MYHKPTDKLTDEEKERTDVIHCSNSDCNNLIFEKEWRLGNDFYCTPQCRDEEMMREI